MIKLCGFSPRECFEMNSTTLNLSVPKECQHFIFMWQRANKRANMPKACQFSTWRANVPETCQFLKLACQCAIRRANYFSKKYIFQYQLWFFNINFSIMVNICQFQKCLSISRKFILRKKEFKFLTFACFSLHVINLVSLTYHAQHKSCWKSIHHVSWLRNCFKEQQYSKI